MTSKLSLTGSRGPMIYDGLNQSDLVIGCNRLKPSDVRICINVLCSNYLVGQE